MPENETELTGHQLARLLKALPKDQALRLQTLEPLGLLAFSVWKVCGAKNSDAAEAYGVAEALWDNTDATPEEIEALFGSTGWHAETYGQAPVSPHQVLNLLEAARQAVRK